MECPATAKVCVRGEGRSERGPEKYEGRNRERRGGGRVTTGSWKPGEGPLLETRLGAPAGNYAQAPTPPHLPAQPPLTSQPRVGESAGERSCVRNQCGPTPTRTRTAPGVRVGSGDVVGTWHVLLVTM